MLDVGAEHRVRPPEVVREGLQRVQLPQNVVHQAHRRQAANTEVNGRASASSHGMDHQLLNQWSGVLTRSGPKFEMVFITSLLDAQ